MWYTIAVTTAFSRQALGDRLGAIAANGPFRVSDPVPAGVGTWTFRLEPARPELAIGFGKVAEFLVLLAREFEVQSLERSTSRAVAAAS